MNLATKIAAGAGIAAALTLVSGCAGLNYTSEKKISNQSTDYSKKTIKPQSDAFKAIEENLKGLGKKLCKMA